ncbi:hypothetical protein DKM19_21300 [Streptosporangium sp. 'caverna']|nr:hypothetical protein DKM19_21300 [Streptosporangium sp. 'caverna']
MELRFADEVGHAGKPEGIGYVDPLPGGGAEAGMTEADARRDAACTPFSSGLRARSDADETLL